MKSKKTAVFTAAAVVFAFLCSVPSIAEDTLNTAESKQLIFNGMLNSVDYFDSAQGRFVTSLVDENEETTVVFDTDIIHQRAYESVISTRTNREVYVSDGRRTTYDHTKKTYETLAAFSPGDTRTLKQKSAARSRSLLTRRNRDYDLNPRITYDENGLSEAHYRNEVTNTSTANLSLFPQDLAFGLLSDMSLWSVEGTASVLQRACYKIQGTGTEYYAGKLDIYTFTLYVDQNTGIILKLETFDASGELSQYLTMTELAVDAPMESIAATDFENAADQYESYTEIHRTIGGLPVAVSSKPVTRTPPPDTGYWMYTNGNEIITEWEIDNDTIASKVANSLRGFDTYLNGSNHYNGDARRSPTGTDARYIWEVINAGAQNASSYACLYMDLHIWLNDASFNDPYAEYWVGDSTISYPFCTINQRVAYPGWNNRSSAKNTSVRPGYFFINNVSVTPGSTSGYYTGADCIRLETSTFTDGTCAVVV